MKRTTLLTIVGIILIIIPLISAAFTGIVVDSHGLPDTQEFAKTTDDGVSITMNKQVLLLNVTKFSLSTATQCAVWNTTDAGINVLATGVFDGDNCSFSDVVLANGASYNITANAGGGLRNRRNTGNPGFPIANTNLDWTDGIDNNGSSSGAIFEIQNITTAESVTDNLIILLINPEDTSSVSGDPSFIANYTLSESIYNLTNITYMVWNSSDDVFNRTVNLTVTGFTNTTNQTLTGFIPGTYKWNVIACGINDTTYECEQEATNFTFSWNSFEVVNQLFQLNASETSSEQFAINLTTEASILSINARINYDGESYIASSTCGSGTCNITTIIDLPLVDAGEDQNKTFFWEFQIFDGSTVFKSNTSSKQQNVSRIYLAECNVTYPTESLNFTAWDEQNLTRVLYDFDAEFDLYTGGGSVKRSYNFTNSSILEINLCIGGLNMTNQTFTNAIIEYGNATYDTRNYYFNNASLTNVTQHIPLYLLNSNDATTFILEVIDEKLDKVPGALINIQRYYPGEALFRTVQIARTDDNGKSIGFYETETVDYKHIIVVNQTVELETTQQKIFPESSPFTLTFQIGGALANPWAALEENPNIQTSLSFNSTNNITTYSYIDVTGATTFGRLTLDRRRYSTNDTFICDVNSTFASATLTCNATGNEGTFVAKGFVGSVTDFVLTDVIEFVISSALDVFGKTGLIAGWFIILTATLAFVWNPTVMIIVHNIAVILVSLIGLIVFSPIYIFGMLGISITLIILLRT